MGNGNLNLTNLRDYCVTARKRLNEDMTIRIQGLGDACRATALMESMNPKNVMRECCENKEHPNVLPIILAIDVSGSMGSTAIQISREIAQIIFEIYKSAKDVHGQHPEFMIMGIGDMRTDRAPVQMGQFESDNRILKSIDDLFFESNGGSNSSESYTAAWYAGAYHTRLDCWKRGKKGIIITIGDECCNDYLPIKLGRHVKGIEDVFGDSAKKEDILTTELYKIASEKFNIAHIDVYHRMNRAPGCTDKNIAESWKLLGANYYHKKTLNDLKKTIIGIINEFAYVSFKSDNSTDSETSEQIHKVDVAPAVKKLINN